MLINLFYNFSLNFALNFNFGGVFGKKKKEKVDGVLQFNFMGNVVFEKVAKAFEKFGFKEIKF